MMLTSLEITNGIITPKYDIYNDYYTVTINNGIDSLNINYNIEDNVLIRVINNYNLDKEEKVVSIDLREGENIRTIYLNVIHEKSSNVSELKDYFVSLETKKNETMPEYIAPLIGSSCFLILIIVFSILFRKKKKLK